MTCKKTIKGCAQDLLARVDFVDCFGRPVGLDYDTILATIRREFPSSRTTKNALRYIYNNLDRNSIRLPARHRSRKILCKEYTRALLLQSDLTYDMIRKRVARKFGDAPIECRSLHRIIQLERQLTREGFKVMHGRE
jgi:hypothetical protein